jgi:hypothetical protein
MDCKETVITLNTMYHLYVEAVKKNKPYKIHKVKQLYMDFLVQASKRFTLIPLDTLENCEQLLGPLSILQLLIEMKNEAVLISHYEIAAQFRDRQKEYIELKIHLSGLDKENKFFCRDEKIFYKTW